MRMRIPWPSARNAVPIAAVVFPFPGPVLTRINPRRTSGMDFASFQTPVAALAENRAELKSLLYLGF